MIAWNDRRKAKKAASNTMKTTLGQMAKTGALRGTPTPEKDPGGWKKHDASMERDSVHREASNLQGMYPHLDRGGAYKEAARRADRREGK